ncbi:MAG TPA: hypothetical protein VGU02_12390 [Gaiellaceae bacterium]|nr:hypothetical protein [Gaiellaceae bacterium]
MTFGLAQLDVLRLAAFKSLAGVVVLLARADSRHERVHLTLVDVALGMFTLMAVISWYATVHVHGAFMSSLLYVVPLSFFWAGRLFGAGIRNKLRYALAVLALPGLLSIAYETFVLRHPMFASSATYQWADRVGTLFRSGGVFIGPPSAASILGMTAIVGIGVLPYQEGRRRSLLRICIAGSIVGLLLTLTRGPIVGFVLGVGVYAVASAPTMRTFFRRSMASRRRSGST